MFIPQNIGFEDFEATRTIVLGPTVNTIEMLPARCISFGKDLISAGNSLLQAGYVYQVATCTTSVALLRHIHFRIPTDIIFRIRASNYSLLGVPLRRIPSSALPRFRVAISLVLTEFLAFAFVSMPSSRRSRSGPRLACRFRKGDVATSFAFRHCTTSQACTPGGKILFDKLFEKHLRQWT